MRGVRHSVEGEDDVEMAVHARSGTAIPNACHASNKIEEESSKQKRHQQQRLVSLDVFRGVTVAVIFLVCCSYFFFICVRFLGNWNCTAQSPSSSFSFIVALQSKFWEFKLQMKRSQGSDDVVFLWLQFTEVRGRIRWFGLCFNWLRTNNPLLFAIHKRAIF